MERLWGARGATGQTARAVLTGPQPQCIGTSRQVRTDRLTDRALLLFGSKGSQKQPSCPPPPDTHPRYSPPPPPICTAQLSQGVTNRVAEEEKVGMSAPIATSNPGHPTRSKVGETLLSVLSLFLSILRTRESYQHHHHNPTTATFPSTIKSLCVCICATKR